MRLNSVQVFILSAVWGVAISLLLTLAVMFVHSLATGEW